MNTITVPHGRAAQLLEYVATGQLFEKTSRAAAHKRIRQAIPWMERTKGSVLRGFLDSPVTVHDMMRSLGKRRPDDIYRMLFTFTKGEARTGYFLSRFEQEFDLLIDAKVVPVKQYRDPDAIYTLTQKIDDGLVESLTEDENTLMMEFLFKPDMMALPSSFSMEMWKNRTT